MFCKIISLQCLAISVAANLHAANFTYSYDSLNRLTNAAYSHGFKESYSYDEAGNRLTRVTGAADTFAPSVPVGLTLSTNGNGEILLSWNQSQNTGEGVAGYSIYLNGLRYTNTATTNIILTGLFPNTSYCVAIAAYDSASNISSQSSRLCFVTPEVNLSGNSVTTISIYPTATANGSTSSNWSSFLTNGIRYLETGQGLSFDRTTPTNYVISDHYEAGDIMTSRSNTYQWRGQFNPPSPFNDQIGNRFRFSVKIASLIPFNLAGLSYEIGSSDPGNIFGSTGGLGNQANYHLTFSGLSYGPDGIKGTADDVWRTSGSSTALVNELYYIGTGPSFSCDSQTDIAAITNFLSNNAPFSFRATYTIRATNGNVLASGFRVTSPSSGLPARILASSIPNESLNFGEVTLGSATNLSFIISNAGSAPITITGIACPYGFTAGFARGLLPPSSQTNITITFRPTIPLSYGGNVAIVSDATVGRDIVLVTGKGIGIGNDPMSIAEIFPSPGPNSTSAAFPYYRYSEQSYLRTGVGLALDRLLPENYTLPPIVETGDILVSTNPVTLWRGQLNPTELFAGEQGGFVRFGLRVVSGIPFNLNGITWDHRASATNRLVYVGALTNASYSVSQIGLWYGPDTIKGTTDDVLRTSGSGVGLINEFYFRGVAVSYYGNTLSQIQAVRNVVIANAPFYLNCTYRIFDTNGVQLTAASATVPVIESIQDLPPRMEPHVVQPPQAFAFEITGSPAAPYAIFVSTNLIDWQLLSNFVLRDWSAPWIDSDAYRFQQRFYRLQTAF